MSISRREFLRVSATAVAGSLLVACGQKAEKPAAVAPQTTPVPITGVEKVPVCTVSDKDKLVLPDDSGFILQKILKETGSETPKELDKSMGMLAEVIGKEKVNKLWSVSTTNAKDMTVEEYVSWFDQLDQNEQACVLLRAKAGAQAFYEDADPDKQMQGLVDSLNFSGIPGLDINSQSLLELGSLPFNLMGDNIDLAAAVRQQPDLAAGFQLSYQAYVALHETFSATDGKFLEYTLNEARLVIDKQWLTMFHFMHHAPDAGINLYNLRLYTQLTQQAINQALITGNGIYFQPETIINGRKFLDAWWVFSKVTLPNGKETLWYVTLSSKGQPITTAIMSQDVEAKAARYIAGKIATLNLQPKTADDFRQNLPMWEDGGPSSWFLLKEALKYQLAKLQYELGEKAKQLPDLLKAFAAQLAAGVNQTAGAVTDPLLVLLPGNFNDPETRCAFLEQILHRMCPQQE